MYYQTITENDNTREMISQFMGYNHNYRINSGEWYDMENLSSDNYPVMTPRDKRALLVETSNIRGILISDNNLTYLAGNVLHYGSNTFDLEEYFRTGSQTDELGGIVYQYDTSEQQLVRFGAYIIAFPSGVYVNVIDRTTGSITEKYESPAGIEITYKICDSTGSDLKNVEARDDAPDDPSDGDYWLRTTTDAAGLYMWVGYLSTWEAVATCYISIEVPGENLAEKFSVGDAVYMNSGISDINSGSIIQSINEDRMIILGLLPRVSITEITDSGWKLSIERKIPDLDMVCVSNNRIWGCHYGEDYSGEVVNEIYASKLGDFKNWYCYAGLSTDSYALSVGEPGEWTGCISYQGYPTFFKENCVMKIYGSMPSEYQLSTHTCRGVQTGSEKSLAIVNEYLVYKSSSDICVYDGSSPTSISAALSRSAKYYEAVAAGCNGKYYVSMENNLGKTINLVYDMEYGLWMKNDSKVRYSQFTQTESGQIYGTTGTKIYGIGANDNIVFQSKLPDEEYVEWYAESGDMGFDYPDHKYVNGLAVRAYIPYKSELNVQISFDDGVWQDRGTYRGNDDTQTIAIRGLPTRCDHYRLRFSGHGDVRVYSVATTLETLSEDRMDGSTH